MNGFITKSVGTLTLGEKLKKLRSERRMSLHEISRVTKIQVKYLEYLEDGRYEKLPVDVYVRGFLRSYAAFFGINENILIKLYEKEKGIKNNLEKSKGKKNSGEKAKFIDMKSFVFTPRIAVIILIPIVLLAGFFYLYREFGSFASVPRLVVTNPPSNYSFEGNSVSVEGITDRDARIFINDQPVLVGDDGRFRENLTLQPGVSIIDVRALNRFDGEKKETLTVQAVFSDEKKENVAEKEEEIVVENPEMEFEIRVDPGPVWLSVETDGSIIFSGTMPAGQVQSFKAKNKVIVNSGRANATFVRLNGKDMGALGSNAGPVKGVEFTADK